MKQLALALVTLLSFELQAKVIDAPYTANLDHVENLPDYSIMHRIELSYKYQVEPIFKKWCYSCHHEQKISTTIENPLNRKIFAKYLQKSFFALDLSPGFPFAGKATALDNLKMIEKAILTEHMPPFWWPILNLSFPMSQAETSRILAWTSATINALEK